MTIAQHTVNNWSKLMQDAPGVYKLYGGPINTLYLSQTVFVDTLCQQCGFTTINVDNLSINIVHVKNAGPEKIVEPIAIVSW